MPRTPYLLPPEAVFLVTGGAGFIGSNLCESLLDMGCEVRCLDDLSTGKMDNVKGLLGNRRFSFIKGDIRDFAACTSASEGVDYVLHQAAWGSVPRSIVYPLLYEEINIRGTLNMLEAARQARVKRFVYASSSSVYGDDAHLPKVEGREGKVLSPYALTKAANEEYARLYHTLYGLETVGLRYFNVFGPRQDPEGVYAAVIPRFIGMLSRGEAPTINGNGENSRDFTYIKNVLEANIKACTVSADVGGNVFNIAHGECTTLNDLYKLIAKALGCESVLPVYGPGRAGDIPHSNADISKAKTLLGCGLAHGLVEGLAETIAWFQQRQADSDEKGGGQQ